MLEAISKKVNYWCFRYLLITELYMVEKWERIMIHIVLFLIFSVISMFNSYVVLGLVSQFLQNSHNSLPPSSQTVPNSPAMDMSTRTDL